MDTPQQNYLHFLGKFAAPTQQAPHINMKEEPFGSVVGAFSVGTSKDADNLARRTC